MLDRDGLYSPRNYATNLIRTLYKRGVNLEKGIRVFEDRFLAESDKDFLLLAVDCMQKGQNVQIKKVKAQHDTMQQQKESEKSSAPGASLSANDKQNIVNLHNMFSQRSKQYIEKVYLLYEKNFDNSLNALLDGGNLPPEDKDELQVIIKQEDQSKQSK